LRTAEIQVENYNDDQDEIIIHKTFCPESQVLRMAGSESSRPQCKRRCSYRTRLIVILCEPQVILPCLAKGMDFYLHLDPMEIEKPIVITVVFGDYILYKIQFTYIHIT